MNENPYVIVHFLTESLGEDRVRVYGPFATHEEAEKSHAASFTRATRKVKIVQLEG